MKQGFTASKNGTWEEFQEIFRKKVKASEWAFDRIKEAFDLVAQDEAEKMSIVQGIVLQSTDYLRRIIAPVGGTRRSHNLIQTKRKYKKIDKQDIGTKEEIEEIDINEMCSTDDESGGGLSTTTRNDVDSDV